VKRGLPKEAGALALVVKTLILPNRPIKTQKGWSGKTAVEGSTVHERLSQSKGGSAGTKEGKGFSPGEGSTPV